MIFMAYGQFNTFRSYRRQMMTAAIELGYGMEVSDRIGKAKTVAEITAIMNRARRNSINKDKERGR